MGTLVRRFERAVQDRATEQEGQAAARAEIAVALAAGLPAVRTLDAILTNRLAGDPATLAVWRRARRIGAPRGSRGATPVPPSVPEVPEAPGAPESGGEPVAVSQR